MIKQTSHRAKSLSALLPGPHPCVSNKVTFEREQRRRVGRWREVQGVREQGGSHRAIWLEEMDFNEFFSQEITEIPSTQTAEKKKKWSLLCISPILNKCHLFLSSVSAKGGQYYSELLLKPIRVSSKTSKCVHYKCITLLFVKLLQGLSFVFVSEKGASRLKTEVNIWVTIVICCR